MRIAIFSDVHGNLYALEAVLADIDRNGPFDEVIFGGDLGHGGPFVSECTRLVRERGYMGVQGNSDLVILQDDPPMPDYIRENPAWRERFHTVIPWSKSQLTESDVAYLRSLSFEIRLSPTNSSEDDLLIFHANPHDVEQAILPPEATQLEMFGKVMQSDADVLALLNGVAERSIMFGHFHHPNVRHVEPYTLINVASVSRPQHPDWRAKYAILTFADGKWTAEHRFVAYDIDAAQQAFANSDMPFGEEEGRLLRYRQA